MVHTKEPWPEPEPAHAGTGAAAIEWHRIPGVADFTRKADADRARECVNACVGWDDPPTAILEMLQAVIDTHETHRAEYETGSECKCTACRFVRQRLKGGG